MTPHAPVTLPELSLRDRVQSFLASGLLAAALPFLAIYYLVSRGRSQSSRRYLRERLGNLPSNLRQAAPGAIWVHAVSVGEALAIGPLLPKLRQRFLGRRILVSTTTVTGQALAAQQLDCDGAFYFPLDFAFACRRALRAIQPALVVIAETEFWPRFLREARLAGARVVVVNGRISDRSFGRYHFWRHSMRPVLAHVDCFLMQSQEDARRARAAPAPPGDCGGQRERGRRVARADCFRHRAGPMAAGAAGAGAAQTRAVRYRSAPDRGVAPKGCASQ